MDAVLDETADERRRRLNRERSRRWRERNPGRAKEVATNWRNNNPERVLEIKRAFRERHREAVNADKRRRYAEKREDERARWTLNNAVQRGKIKKGSCASADESCKGRVEGHHEDYSRPLDVVWLCQSHHTRLHHLAK